MSNLIARIITAACGEPYGDGDRITNVIHGYADGSNDDAIVVLGNWSPTRFPRALKDLAIDQTAGMVFMGTALTISALHPFIHHIENGALDSILDYVYATSLNAMNRNNG